MIFQELNLEEYSNFCDNHECKNFFQTKMMAKRYDLENQKYYLLGVKENNKIVLASLALLKGKTLDLLKGPILDYNNTKLLEFFTKEIKKFAKKIKVKNVLIDPYIMSIQRDSDGNIIENGINNLKIKENLIKLGYIYLGEYTQVKWIYCKDINNMSYEKLFKTFKQNTRNLISRANSKYNIKILKCSYEDLDRFKKITENTAKRRGFEDKSLKYYQNMYKAFEDQIVYYIAILNIPNYIKSLEEEKEKLKEREKKLINNKNKLENLKEELNIINKKIDEAKELQKEKGDEVDLAAAMFSLYQDEIVYLFSGAYNEYMKYLGQYKIQEEIIKYACENNYKRYNFYGIKDFKNPNSQDYGVYEFKKGFQGYVEELLGTFKLPITFSSKMLTKIKNIFKKIS